MTKRELINALEAINLPDDATVKIWDHKKDASEGSDGDTPSSALYDLEVGILNDDLSDQDKDYFQEQYGFEPKPFIALSFDNPDIEDYD